MPQTTNNPSIDWEKTMKNTEENARVAATMTERAVSALAEAIAILQRQSQRLSHLEETVEEIRMKPLQLPAQHHPSLPQHQTRRPHLLPVFAIFIVGLFCGVFIGNL